MSKDIEMFEISDKNEAVGTEIFDPSLPSNLDFQEKIEDQHENTLINPQKKVPEMGKVLIIGNDLKAFTVKGHANSKPKPQFHPTTVIHVPVHTHPVKLFDQQSKGLKSFWQSIVGHSKREIFVQEGFLYIAQRQKDGLLIRSSIELIKLFKVFVDPQQESIRLVVNQDEHLVNKDMQPENFILVVQMINHELNRMGLTLSD